MTRIPLIIAMMLGLLWGQGAHAQGGPIVDPNAPTVIQGIGGTPTTPPTPTKAQPTINDAINNGDVDKAVEGAVGITLPKTRLAETCQTFEDIQGDTTGNNPAASLTQNFLRAFATLQIAFNTKIADASVGLGLILLVVFSLFYVLRMLFPFTPYGQIADTYNQIFNLWGVAIVVFLIVMNPNFIPNNVVYPIFKGLINANFSLLQVSSTLANDATGGKAKTDPSCLGQSGGSDPLERMIRGIVEQTTYAQGVSMSNLCISLSIIGFANPDDGDRCFEANKKREKQYQTNFCKQEGNAAAVFCAVDTIGGVLEFFGGLVQGALGVLKGTMDLVGNKFSGGNVAEGLFNTAIALIFGFGLFMIALYKYLMIGLYMLEAAMLPFILSAFWSLIMIIGIIPAGREVIKTAFFAVLQGGATIIFLGVGLSVIAAMDTFVWYQFTKDPNMIQKTLVGSTNFMYAWPLWMILITSFAGINALKQARSMAESVFKTGLSLEIADSLFNTFKGMVYFAMDVVGDLAFAGGFSKIRRVVLR
ncbi:MAG: hypothetical protein ACK5O4_01160 [bacterium]|jgi:hypothetical protein